MVLFTHSENRSPVPPPQPTLRDTMSKLRQLAGDRLRQSEIPQVRQSIRKYMYKHIVDPLWQQVDDESDPLLRVTRVQLVTCVDEYLQLTFDPPPARDPCAPGAGPDVFSRKMKLIDTIRKLQQELKHERDGDFNL
jgi:hypothetical protein